MDFHQHSESLERDHLAVLILSCSFGIVETAIENTEIVLEDTPTSWWFSGSAPRSVAWYSKGHHVDSLPSVINCRWNRRVVVLGTCPCLIFDLRRKADITKRLVTVRGHQKASSLV